MKIIKKSLLLLLFSFLVLPSSILAQDKRPMTLVDRLEVPDLRDANISRDGKHLIYLLSEADWKANKQISHIWRINRDGTGLRQMTFGSQGERNPKWSPDGKQIAFVAKREGVKTADDGRQTPYYFMTLDLKERSDGGSGQQPA